MSLFLSSVFSICIYKFSNVELFCIAISANSLTLCSLNSVSTVDSSIFSFSFNSSIVLGSSSLFLFLTLSNLCSIGPSKLTNLKLDNFLVPLLHEDSL